MLINYMTAFLFEKIEKRTEKQAKIIEVIEKFPYLTFEAVGEEIGYKQNAGLNISKVLTRSGYYFIKELNRDLFHF